MPGGNYNWIVIIHLSIDTGPLKKVVGYLLTSSVGYASILLRAGSCQWKGTSLIIVIIAVICSRRQERMMNCHHSVNEYSLCASDVWSIGQGYGAKTANKNSRFLHCWCLYFIKYFAYFLIGFLSLLSCKNSLYLAASYLSDMCLANLSFQSVTCLFILIVSFEI